MTVKQLINHGAMESARSSAPLTPPPHPPPSLYGPVNLQFITLNQIFTSRKLDSPLTNKEKLKCSSCKHFSPVFMLLVQIASMDISYFIR